MPMSSQPPNPGAFAPDRAGDSLKSCMESVNIHQSCIVFAIVIARTLQTVESVMLAIAQSHILVPACTYLEL